MSTVPPDPASSPAPASGMDHDALPPGTRFGEFEIVRVLGVGGFGIVYLANDHSLEREVALKEYMPASLAARGAGPQITVRSSSFAETYAIGLRSFVNEARLLARFDHPSLVKVYRFWEDNATAYMVMPYLQGVTLRDTRRRMAHPPDEPWIRSVIAPILVGARAAAPRRRLPPRHRARQHPAAARRPADPARLRRGAPRHQRPHPVADRDPEAQLRADRAVRRDDAAAPGPVDRPLRAGRGHPLPAVRRSAGAGHRARGAGRCRVDREPHRPRRVAALPRGRLVDALGATEPAAAERRAAAHRARRPRPGAAARPARHHDSAQRRPAGCAAAVGASAVAAARSGPSSADRKRGRCDHGQHRAHPDPHADGADAAARPDPRAGRHHVQPDGADADGAAAAADHRVRPVADTAHSDRAAAAATDGTGARAVAPAPATRRARSVAMAALAAGDLAAAHAAAEPTGAAGCPAASGAGGAVARRLLARRRRSRPPGPAAIGPG